MATHSSILTWRIPWTKEPGRLQSIGSQRVGHNWVTNIFTFCTKQNTTILTFMNKPRIHKVNYFVSYFCYFWCPYLYLSITWVSCTMLCLATSDFCDPMDCSPPGSLSMGILQTMPSSRGSSQPGDRTKVSCIVGGFFSSWATREAPGVP